MKTVALRYGVTFGKCDGSDWIDWEMDLSEEEEAAYNNAIKMRIPLCDVEKLQSALDRAYEDIEAEEIDNGLSYDDEYTMECQGEIEVDPGEINDLIANRDPHALTFFGLTDADEEELSEWDANDLDELPLIKDFEENFEPRSPFDYGWTLHVEFVDPNEDEDVTKEEVERVLTELFNLANGDYTEIHKYIERVDYNYYADFDLEEFAKELAEKLGITDF